MLSPTEAAARNRKVDMMRDDRLITRIERSHDEMVRRIKHGTKADKAPRFPRCKPSNRAPRKIYMGGKAVAQTGHHVKISTPAPVGERTAPCNGLTSWAK